MFYSSLFIGVLDSLVLHQNTDVKNLRSEIVVKIYVLSDIRMEAEASVYLDGKYQFNSKFIIGNEINSGKKVIRNENMETMGGTLITLGVIKILNATLWWPRGYGGQDLYEIEIRYFNPVDYYDTNTSPLIQSLKRKLGLRTVELIQEPIINSKSEFIKNEIYNVQQTTFYFRINSISIFMKGANFIPIDAFQSRITQKDRGYLLGVAAESNMNMIRVEKLCMFK